MNPIHYTHGGLDYLELIVISRVDGIAVVGRWTPELVSELTRRAVYTADGVYFGGEDWLVLLEKKAPTVPTRHVRRKFRK